METQLTIKHLAAYLPFGLKFRLHGNYPIKEGVDNWITDFQTLDIKRIDRALTDKNFKPILRPLSDLTKEIEVNGEKFVPLMVLFGGETYRKYDFTIGIVEKPIIGKYIDISVKGLGDHCITFGLKNPLNNNLTYHNWSLLLEWHFDIFGLIPDGLAVDINTLEK